MPAFLHGGIGEKVSDDQYSLSAETRNDDVVVEAVVTHILPHSIPLTLPLSPRDCVAMRRIPCLSF
jgi:hypothetical protein